MFKQLCTDMYTVMLTFAWSNLEIIGRQFSLHSTRVYEMYEISHLKVDQKYVFDIKCLLQKSFLGLFLLGNCIELFSGKFQLPYTHAKARFTLLYTENK